MMTGAANFGKTNPARTAHRHPNEDLHAGVEVLVQLPLDKSMNL